MNIVSSKKRGLYIEEDILQKKISDIISISIIALLSCVIIITSALIFDLVKTIKADKYSIVYVPSTVQEEHEPLRINF